MLGKALAHNSGGLLLVRVDNAGLDNKLHEPISKAKTLDMVQQALPVLHLIQPPKTITIDNK